MNEEIDRIDRIDNQLVPREMTEEEAVAFRAALAGPISQIEGKPVRSRSVLNALLAELERLRAESTPGEWLDVEEVIQPNKGGMEFEPHRIRAIITAEEHPQFGSQERIIRLACSPYFEKQWWVEIDAGDAAFIVAAHNHFPAILEYVRRLQKEVKLWKPMTTEEAEAALAEVKADPISEEEVNSILKRILDPAERMNNREEMGMREKILSYRLLLKLRDEENKRLRAEIEGLKEKT